MNKISGTIVFVLFFNTMIFSAPKEGEIVKEHTGPRCQIPLPMKDVVKDCAKDLWRDQINKKYGFPIRHTVTAGECGYVQGNNNEQVWRCTPYIYDVTHIRATTKGEYKCTDYMGVGFSCRYINKGIVVKTREAD